MIETIIVDDEIPAIDSLKTLLRKYCPEVKVIDSALNVQDAKKKINSLKPSLVFLDIDMPDKNGFELLKSIKEIPFEVIFTTAYNEYAVQAIKNNALDYLLKPINADELITAINRFKTKKAKEPTDYNKIENLILAISQSRDVHKLPIPTLDGILYIEPESIIHLEADSNYTHIYLLSGQRITSSKILKEYENMLKGRNFFRIQKTHLINLSYVKRYGKSEGGFVIMSNEAKIKISINKKKQFLSHLSISK